MTSVALGCHPPIWDGNRVFQIHAVSAMEVQGPHQKQVGVKVTLIIRIHTLSVAQLSCRNILLLKAVYYFLIKLKCQYNPEAFLQSHPDLSSVLSKVLVCG